jgi:hypothetical protein
MAGFGTVYGANLLSPRGKSGILEVWVQGNPDQEEPPVRK